MLSFLRPVSFALLMILLPLTASAGAIRDAEIEADLRSFANPIFENAGHPCRLMTQSGHEMFRHPANRILRATPA